ncbi:hypothetical protein A3F02_03255 [Candidatus Curtissbacteria bacterium RIFCSPHIGHO2_12_FULL_38_9b]|uniref:SpoVT-AbrB domain-containing protein n=2 Tax=Candidatus Curtissiibacteriota TaxID=1752717 RepID=A0A1F5GXE9_9BACT|nr:MAG: hypothetical protein A3A48_02420 [Candidatus Curtissbacteria bacterium RIFCSPLOWO2_01_FULL_37_9]OGD96600.1 MAG: hypothetical protein A3F02_03255 [Candidatus Curtissbacteria bacterium RIFCSPHIGHO2_12_FULL_38_9b]
MQLIASITSKRQLTIPASIYKKVKFSERQKVLVTEIEGQIIITPFVDLVEKLAGSLKVPKRWKGRNIDEIIENAKSEYFTKPKVNDLR